MPKKILVTLFFLSSIFSIYSQNRFQEEVNFIQEKNKFLWNKNEETIVFTGSSSIRLWKNLDTIFPKNQIINTGFGASLSGDLLHYVQELILNYKPVKVFIYEGENDIAYDKTPKKIIQNINNIIKKIRNQNSQTYIVLISAKPSIKRWHLRKKYKRFNRKLKRVTKKDRLLHFVNVWKPMLNGNKINTKIFNKDGLHMNKEGYNIWYSVIKKHLN